MTGKTMERALHLLHNNALTGWATVEQSGLARKTLDEMHRLGMVDHEPTSDRFVIAQRTINVEIAGAKYSKPFPLSTDNAGVAAGTRYARICRTDRTRLEWATRP